MGAGAGVGVAWVHGTAHAGPISFPVGDVGLSLGVLGIAGVDVPLTRSVSLFAESRLSGDWDVGLGNAQLGGFSGTSGARVRF